MQECRHRNKRLKWKNQYRQTRLVDEMRSNVDLKSKHQKTSMLLNINEPKV